MTSVNSWVFRTQTWLARNSTWLTVVIGAFHSLALAFAVVSSRYQLAWIAVFVSLTCLIIAANIVPSRYRKVELLQSFMELIHRAMSFSVETERVTLHHVVSEKRERYEQLTHYYPSGVGRGRSWSYSSGIVGATIKNKAVRVYSVPADKTWDEAMKRDWAFTSDELARLTKDRNSYFTFPIMDATGAVIAVLFFDSALATTFTDANKPVIEEKVRQWFAPQLRLLLEN